MRTGVLRSRVRAALITLGLFATVTACNASETDAVTYHRVRIDNAGAPDRYSAPWPSRVADLERWFEASEGLPMSHAIDGLLAGDLSLWQRFSQASRAVPATEREVWVRKHYGFFAYQTPAPGFCRRAQEEMGAGPSSLLRDAVAVPFAGYCADEADRAAILREDTPPAAVIEFFAGRWRSDGERDVRSYDPRFAEAVRSELAVLKDPFERLSATGALLIHPDPRAEAALIAIWRGLPPGEEKTSLALQFSRARSAEGRAIAAAACKGQESSQPCKQEANRLAGMAEMEKLGLGSAQPSDDAAESAMASRQQADSPDKVRSVAERLVSLGFVPRPEFQPTQARDADPLGLLAAMGLVHAFDVETGQFPNQHDSLLRALAALTGDALAGAIFAEEPPRMVDRQVQGRPESEEIGPYRLTAWLGGKRYRIDAENHGDWYDVDAVLILLNAMLKDRGSSLKLHALAGDGQVAMILAATPSAYAKAVSAGLIEAGEPDTAERLGKEFEQEVFEKIKRD